MGEGNAFYDRIQSPLVMIEFFTNAHCRGAHLWLGPCWDCAKPVIVASLVQSVREKQQYGY
jgi:hypothetical protein